MSCKYRNPPYSLSERQYVERNSNIFNLMTKELYEIFRSCDLVNYCGQHHCVLTRSTRSLHDKCTKFSKGKILGSSKKETIDNFLRLASSHGHVNHRGEILSIFFYNKLSHSEKLNVKRTGVGFQNLNNPNHNHQNTNINEAPDNSVIALEENLTSHLPRPMFRSAVHVQDQNPLGILLSEFRDFKNTVTTDFQSVKQRFAQIENTVSGVVNRVVEKIPKRRQSAPVQRGRGRGRGRALKGRRVRREHRIEEEDANSLEEGSEEESFTDSESNVSSEPNESDRSSIKTESQSFISIEEEEEEQQEESTLMEEEASEEEQDSEVLNPVRKQRKL